MGLPGRRPGKADGQQVGIGAEDDSRHILQHTCSNGSLASPGGYPDAPREMAGHRPVTGSGGRYRDALRVREFRRSLPPTRCPSPARWSPRSPSWSSSTHAPGRRCSRRSRSRSDSCPISSRAPCSRRSSTASRCVGCSSSATRRARCSSPRWRCRGCRWRACSCSSSPSGTVASLASGGRSALLPLIVSVEAFVPARSLFRIAAQSAQIVGNATGGALLIVVSPRGAILVNATSYLVSAALMRRASTGAGVCSTRRPNRHSSETRSKDYGPSSAHVPLRRLLLFGWLVPTFSVAPEALAAPYVADLGKTAALVGWWLVAIPLGVVVGRPGGGLGARAADAATARHPARRRDLRAAARLRRRPWLRGRLGAALRLRPGGGLRARVRRSPPACGARHAPGPGDGDQHGGAHLAPGIRLRCRGRTRRGRGAEPRDRDRRRRRSGRRGLLLPAPATR